MTGPYHFEEMHPETSKPKLEQQGYYIFYKDNKLACALVRKKALARLIVDKLNAVKERTDGKE